METATTKSLMLKVISVLFICGGAIRLIANRATFQSFLIGQLWSSHPYSIYIYRVLGAFVVFVGISLFIAAGEPRRYAILLRAWSIGFTFIGIVMLVAGALLRLAIVHYAPDIVFCFVIAIALYVAQKQ
ncbi:hypothetical protein AMJ87_08785 [candidate division WOR_3 bacterium SM23_60]|uniref:Uncharacterized protein n=1 Tax=candidate division WOR_3 bacterium SM23_60 TaxID=1703780 RepID=A0A0S8GBK3_UNCW3|nr:MAG: hypothetical protein AMJ87_08785 [candidate division WOR_3 bacterium SM23_60]